MAVPPLFSQSYHGGLGGVLGSLGPISNDQSPFYQELYRLEAERQQMRQQVMQQQQGSLASCFPSPRPEDYNSARVPKTFREELQAETDAWLK